MGSIPRLEKFCFCLSVYQGVLFFSIGLALLWIVRALGILASGSSLGNSVWTLVWCIANVIAYGLVLLAMRRSNKTFMIPALILCVFNIVVGIIAVIIELAYLLFFGAIVLLIIVCLT